MKRFARVEDNIVKEILVCDELPPFTPEIQAQFQEVSSNIIEGWVFDQGNFVPPPPPPPQELEPIINENNLTTDELNTLKALIKKLKL